MNRFINPADAEDRNVYCGNCNGPVKGHMPGCDNCNAKFHPNKWGYARLCKNPSCMRTEMAGHAHGLCRYHHEKRKYRQAMTALQPNCACGNKASLGEKECSRCRASKAQNFEPLGGGASDMQFDHDCKNPNVEQQLD